MTWEKDILQAFEKHVKEDTIDTTLYDSKFFNLFKSIAHYIISWLI